MLSPGEVFGRFRLSFLHEIFIFSREEDFPSMDSCPWADVDDMVALPHDIFIMFDNDNRISYQRESLQIGDEHVIVTRMKADGWLIQDVDDSFQSRTYLSSEAYSL